MMDDLYGGRTVTTYTYSVDADRPPAPRFPQDPASGTFRLTSVEVPVETLRDDPTRYFLLEPDPEAGPVQPVMRRGRLVYVYICREYRNEQ
jgi:hypothetical protein